MPRGGAREGAGRTSNAARFRDEIAGLNALIAEHVPEIFAKGMELIRGVEVERKVGKNPVVYSQPPCARTIAYFLDRFAGRPMQAVEVTGEEGGPLRIEVVYADAIAPADDAEAAPGPGEDPPGDPPV